LVDMRAAATGERAGDGEAYVYVLAKTSATISPRADGVEGTTEVGIQASLLYGPGLYQVDPWVTDRHNLRAAPRLTSPVVGNLLGGDAVDVAKAVTVHLSGGEREHWAQLVRTSPGPPAWALLASSGGMKFLRYVKRPGPDRARLAGPDAQGQSQAAALDRAIADQLGHVEADDSDLAELIDRLVEHEWDLGGEEAELNRMGREHQETTEKSKAKKAENVTKSLLDNLQQSKRQQEAKRKKQRETWEMERPELSVRRVEQMASLEESRHAIDTEFEERLRQLREKRAREAAADLAKQPSSWGGYSSAEPPVDLFNFNFPGEEDPAENPKSAADAAKVSAEAAREAASRAARSLAGVSDAPLAEALVAMEAQCASFYRKSVFSC